MQILLIITTKNSKTKTRYRYQYNNNIISNANIINENQKIVNKRDNIINNINSKNVNKPKHAKLNPLPGIRDALRKLNPSLFENIQYFPQST